MQIIDNFRNNFSDLKDFVIEYPVKALVAGIFVAVLICSVWDIWEGEWISHSGKVTGKWWNIRTVCNSYDKDSNCTSWGTETDYYLTVWHQGESDYVEVMVWTYYKYSVNDPVQISYRQGGVFGVRWFATINDPKPDF